MQNEIQKSSYCMNTKDEEKHLEYVISMITNIYNFNHEDDDQLLMYRELIRNTISLYNKSKEMEDLEYGEQ